MSFSLSNKPSAKFGKLSEIMNVCKLLLKAFKKSIMSEVVNVNK